jgi:hypothetical protein
MRNKVQAVGRLERPRRVCDADEMHEYTLTVHEITVLGLPVRRQSGHYYVTCRECGWRTQLGYDLSEELHQAS